MEFRLPGRGWGTLMQDGTRIRRYAIDPNDRVLRSFFLSTAFFSGIGGPVGSGKTLAALQRFILFARRQAPHPRDGVRRTRWLAVRDTYRNLEKTTIRSWNDWWPRTVGEWRGGANGEPGVHNIAFGLPDGTRVETEIMFAATGDQDVQEFAGGFEITGFNLEEAADHNLEVADKLLERVGRYPAVEKDEGFAGATWSGGWCTFNMPNYGHWIETEFVSAKRASWEFFRQPGGFDQDAENLSNLRGGRNYYYRMAEGKPDHEVRRFIKNQFGFSRSGKPVYPEYDPFYSLSQQPLKPLRGRRLVCGLDQGQSPAAVFVQRDTNTQLRILRELALKNVGPDQFGRILRQFADEHFRGWEIDYVADPAAFNKTDTSEDDDDVWVMLVQPALGDVIRPAPSHKRVAREKNLRVAMLNKISRDVPGLLIDPSCQMVHQGFLQHFRYKKISGPGQPERYALDIDKTDHSHPCEAAEYGVMGVVDFSETMGFKMPGDTRRALPDDDVAWRPGEFAHG